MHLLCNAQGGVWTWVKGDTLINSSGHFGSIGISDAADYPPSLYQAVQWTDLNGNFWIFGGTLFGANGGIYNDLWEYQPATNIWTWVNGPDTINGWGVYGTQGIPGPNNIPGARAWGCESWTDQQGRLWMHGGDGVDANGDYGGMDDLWMYDIPTNQWTWMKGPDTIYGAPIYGTLRVPADSNTPGNRAECNTAWVKSDGTLWLFGGASLYSFYNDMWKFDIGTNNWTWMSGNKSGNANYNYGTLNVESPYTLPPVRYTYTHWQDKNDNFYIFGGQGTHGAGNYFYYNDLWRYNTINNEWTWMGGSSSPQDTGLIDGFCSPNTKSLPAPRYENRSAQMNGCSDIGWIFGGVTSLGYANDLWSYNIKTAEWTLVSMNGYDGNGSFGSINTPSINNNPPANFGGCLWQDANGTIWSWGAADYLPGPMWKFELDPTCTPAYLYREHDIQVSDTPLCVGDTGHVSVKGGKIISISPSSDTYQVDSSHINIVQQVSTSYKLITTGVCDNIDTSYFTINFCYIDTPFVMPTAFTPNGDAKNELFYPVLTDTAIVSVTGFNIYNRWGQLVYNNPTLGWDGRYKGEPQPEGIYTYFVTVSFPDANNPGRMKEMSQEGSFALLR